MGLLMDCCACCARRLVVGMGSRAGTAGLVLGLLLALAIPRPSKPERVFHRRDHKDQDILNPYSSTKVIENPHQARIPSMMSMLADITEYLETVDQIPSNRQRGLIEERLSDGLIEKLWLGKYGYLNCTRYQEPEVTTQSSSSIEEGVKALYRDCNVPEDEYKDALRLFQRKFHLSPTGELDFDTKQVMSRNRCGNKDTEDAPGRDPSLGGTSRSSSSSGSDVSMTGSPSSSSSGSEEGGSSSLPITQLPGPSSRGRAKRHALDILEARRRHRAALRLERQRRSFGPVVKEHFPQPQSELLRKILGPNSPVPRQSSRFRREAMLREFKERFRKEDYQPPLRSQDQFHQRHKRSVVTSDAPNGTMVFNKDPEECVTWRLVSTGYSTRIPQDTQRSVLNLAFRMWSEVIPLCFNEDTTSDINNVNIEIVFGRGNHANCDNPFDGRGGDLAHSWPVGDIHFDDEEDYKSDNTRGISLLKVAVHEIGHVLSLSHTERSYSVMFAIYITISIEDQFELGWEDRKEVQKVYGVCKGTFDIIFDWVRWDPVQGLIYNTYFFRAEKYWMYENRHNRTRYGDPLLISVEWKGIPNNVDGYVQKLWEDGTGKNKRWHIETHFFKGEDYFFYNDTDDRIATGYPKLIATEFGPKVNSTERIPDNIDSVYFDHRDRNFYFFKGEWVWVYDPFLEIDERGCCERKERFDVIFPPVEGTPENEILHGNIDTAYYSWEFKKLFFLKGEEVYENVGFTKSGRNGLAKISSWYHKWYDICDTEPSQVINTLP